MRKKQEAEAHRARVLVGTFALDRLGELPTLRELIRSDLLPALARDADRELLDTFLNDAPAPAPANDRAPVTAPAAATGAVGGFGREPVESEFIEREAV